MTMRFEGDQAPIAGMNEAALQVALERKPEVSVPTDFAARVAAQAATLSPSRTSRVPHFARLTALVVSVIVALSLFALAPRTAASFGNLAFDIEVVVLLQLGLLAWWLTKQPGQGR